MCVLLLFISSITGHLFIKSKNNRKKTKTNEQSHSNNLKNFVYDTMIFDIINIIESYLDIFLILLCNIIAIKLHQWILGFDNYFYTNDMLACT